MNINRYLKIFNTVIVSFMIIVGALLLVGTINKEVGIKEMLIFLLIMTYIIIIEKFILHYIRNAVIDIQFENDKITFVKVDHSSVVIENKECIEVKEIMTGYIFYFSDHTKLVMRTNIYSCFYKPRFDFEKIKQDNFPYAKFTR